MDNGIDQAVEDAVRQWADREGRLLPVLHAVQDRLGCIPDQAVPRIARALNLSRAEVHGVISFYHHFRRKPPGRHVIRVCRAEACQSMGAERLIAHAQSRLGIGFHETTADGRVTLEPVYCLGNCACSPALMVDDRLHGRVDPQAFEDILHSLDAPA